MSTETTKKRKFPLTVRGVLEAGRDLYVSNRLNPKGAIFLTLHGDGQPVQCLIPPTSHPYNLSERYTESTLLNSNELRAALSTGKLELVDPDAAEAKLTEPGVREEIRAADQLLKPSSDDVKRYRSRLDEPEEESVAEVRGNRPIRSTKDIPVLENTTSRTNVIDPSVAGADDAELKLRTGTASPVRPQDSLVINPIVSMLLQQLQSNDVTPTDVKMRLANSADVMTEEDWLFVQSKTSGQLREWAAQQLAKLRGLDGTATTE